jgi:hypothetical protein
LADKSSFHIPGKGTPIRKHDRRRGADPPKNASGNTATGIGSSLKEIFRPVIAGKESSIADAILLQRDLGQFQNDI